MTTGSISAVQSSEWKEVALSEGISLLSGHHVLAKFCNDDGIGTPYLTGPSDFTGGRIAHTKYTTRPTTICKAGDTLITVKGSGVGSLSFADGNYAISRQLMAVRTADWNSRFVYYFLASSSDRFEGAATGLIPGLSRSDLLDLRVYLPSRSEQNAIAQALRDIDDLIASLDALIAKKRHIKQAAMQKLLTGKARLPGFEGHWASRTVGQVCDVRTGPFGAQLHESDYVNDGTPIITVENLGELGVEVDEDVPLVSDADRRRLQNYSLRRGDIVFSRVGSIDRNALIGAKEEGWLFSGRLLRLRPENSISSAFLSQIFHSDPFKELVRSVAVGQTMPSLNTKIVKALPILLPAKLEQDAIAQVFADIDGDLASSEARIVKAKGLKQGMMQQLLTGRIRLV